MYLREETEKVKHTRTSKLGHSHEYYREKTVVVFRCDSCQEEFKRDRQRMSPKRLSNNFYHVCDHCDVKRFAQQKGVESRKIWDMPVSSLKTLDQL